MLDLDDYTSICGIEEESGLLKGENSELVATILKRTPTAKLTRAVVGAVMAAIFDIG